MERTNTNDKTEINEKTPVKEEQPQTEQKELKKQSSKTSSQKKSNKKESEKSKKEEQQIEKSIEGPKDDKGQGKEVNSPLEESKNESVKSNKESKKSTTQSKKDKSADSQLKTNENKVLDKKVSKQAMPVEEAKNSKNIETPVKKKAKKTPVKRKSKAIAKPSEPEPKPVEKPEESNHNSQFRLSRNFKPGVTGQKMYSTSVAKRAYVYLKDFDESNFLKNKLERVEADKLRLKAQLNELENESNYLRSQLHRIRNQHALPRPVEINYNVSDNLSFLRTINNEKKLREDRMKKMRETHKQKQVLTKQQLLNQEKEMREKLLTDKKNRILNNISQINERANIRKINNNMANKLVKELLNPEKDEGIENKALTNTE